LLCYCHSFTADGHPTSQIMWFYCKIYAQRHHLCGCRVSYTRHTFLYIRGGIYIQVH
jgi:hypothetical protein